MIRPINLLLFANHRLNAVVSTKITKYIHINHKENHRERHIYTTRSRLDYQSGFEIQRLETKKPAAGWFFMVVHTRVHDIYSSWPFNITQNEPGSVNRRHKKADIIADTGSL